MYLYTIKSNVHCEIDTALAIGNQAAALPVCDSEKAEVSVLYHTVIRNGDNTMCQNY
jgi:hypothetical protein